MSVFDGIGGFVTSIMGSKNKTNAQAPKTNKLAYRYGGTMAGESDAANRYKDMATAAQKRQAAQAGQVNTDYTQANQSRAQSLDARGQQNSLAAVMANRATGGAPTVAQMQADRQMQQAQASQASMASSARGAGALANAQRNAANNVANAQAGISGQAQINAAGERRDDTNAAAGAYANLRGGDVAQQGQDAGQAQFTTSSNVAQNQFNAGQKNQMTAQNDQFTNAMTQNEMGVHNAQLAASQNEQAQNSANSLQAQGINAGVAGQNANMNQVNGMNAL